MTKEAFEALLEPLMTQVPGNVVEEVYLYETPITAYGAADDPLFETLRAPHVVGEHMFMSKDWLPGAVTVVSLFFPFTERVRTTNAEDFQWPSREWTIARVEGQQWIGRYMETLRDTLNARGMRALVPILDERFWAENDRYTSNWSERHVGYVCGMGTFGLHKGLISRRGTAGRYSSMIVDAAWETTERDYEAYDAYCSKCGVCIPHCPPRAISLEKGKDHPKCAAFVSSTTKRFAPRFGCGKCQVKTPCETGIPGRNEG